jgi:hypothetical protein
MNGTVALVAKAKSVTLVGVTFTPSLGPEEMLVCWRKRIMKRNNFTEEQIAIALSKQWPRLDTKGTSIVEKP